MVNRSPKSLKPNPLNDKIYDPFNQEASVDLIESIKLNGILEPIVLNLKNEILSGHRRWHVAILLGIDLVPVEYIENLELDERKLIIEYNRYRHKTVSERMREAELLTELETERAAERRATHSSSEGRAATIVADAVGMKTRTFEKAKVVYEAAKDNLNAKAILEKINSGTMSIDAGHKAIRTLSAPPPSVEGEIDPAPDFIRSFTSWAFAENDPRFGQPHPGRIPGQIAGNLIWYLTKPDDLIIDPMAGGGSTLDVAKFLKRRCIGYDVAPKRLDIEPYDITEGYPKGEAPSLIFIDPPYWNMVVEDYSDESISNKSLDDYEFLIGSIISESFNKLKPGGYLAIINMSSYYRLPDSVKDYYIDWPIVIHRFMQSIGFLMRYRIAVTYPTTLYGGFHVVNAKSQRQLLPNLGDIIVGQKG